MTTLREAAQQALDYWEQVAWGDAVMVDKMDALRAALAQQAEPVLQGPVRIKPGSYTLGATWVGGGGGSGGAGAPPQQAEPVAWSHNLIDNIITHRPADIDRHPDRWTPLYTSPPPQPTPSMDEITRLRAERDALADRLREVRALLADTIDAHRKKVVMNAWAEQKLARHGIPMPEGDPK